MEYSTLRIYLEDKRKAGTLDPQEKEDLQRLQQADRRQPRRISRLENLRQQMAKPGPHLRQMAAACQDKPASRR